MVGQGSKGEREAASDTKLLCLSGGCGCGGRYVNNMDGARSGYSYNTDGTRTECISSGAGEYRQQAVARRRWLI